MNDIVPDSAISIRKTEFAGSLPNKSNHKYPVLIKENAIAPNIPNL